MKTDAGLRRAVRLALGALGFSCVVTQLALTRELLGAFSGNEIIFGIVLGCWLLLMGIGSWLGRISERMPHPQLALGVLQILLALIPLAQVFVVRAFRNVVFVRGADVGLAETALSCGGLLLPYCLLAGFALALGCTVLAKSQGPTGIGTGYILDSLGTILGGVLFSLIFVRFFDHMRILVFPAGFCFISAAALGLSCNRKWFSMLAGALVVGVLPLFFLVDLDALSSCLQFPGQRILARANSPYGKLLVTESDGQLNVIENGLAITSTRDEQHVEETVHYAMCQRPQATNVLLVSGGISGTGNEIHKYGAVHIDYVELDPLIIELGGKYLPQNLAGDRLRVINHDARVYLKQADAKYDVIIVDLPPPSTVQLNRFYSVEFFGEAKQALAANGVFSFALGTYENYLSPELKRVLSSGRATLQALFTNTLAVPGSRVFFLGSDGPLYSDFASRLEQRGIKNKLVNRHYLEAMLTPDRLAQVAQGSTQPARLNRDFSPVLYYLHLRHWMSQFTFSRGAVLLVFLIGLGVYIVRLRGNAVVLFASGFAGSSLEFVLLVAFQVMCGSVYHQVAMIVTAFMAGLAIGAWLSNRRLGVVASAAGRTTGSTRLAELTIPRSDRPVPGFGRDPIVLLALGLAAYSLALPLFLPWTSALGSSPVGLLAVKTTVCLVTAVLGLLIGAQFPLANQREQGTPGLVVSRLYTADFVGAFTGAILAGAILLPLIGVFGVCLLTGALNAVAALALARAKRRN